MKDRDFDQILDAWMDRGPTVAPERVAAAARLEARSTRQRQARWPARRFLAMNSPTRIGLAAAGVVVAAAAVVVLAIPSPISPTGGSLFGDPEPTAVEIAEASFVPAGSLVEARARHTATLLTGGRVLVVGGANGGSPLGSAEIWDPASRAFSPVGSMDLPRQGHTATLLSDGRVLITGGQDGLAGDSAEIWDPTGESFSSTGSMAERRSWHTATRLPDGRVLVVGGDASPAVGLGGGVSVASAEVWDPASGSFSPAGSLLEARARHNATLLPDGRVLVTGGIRSRDNSGEGLSSAEVWDPVTMSFSRAGSFPGCCLDAVGDVHAATLLSDGRVLVIGGSFLKASAATAIWDPESASFSVSESLLAARTLHSATLLPDGNVLVVGGVGPDVGPLAYAEIYDHQSETFVVSGELADGRAQHTATLLSDGRVLVVGGEGLSGVLASAELWSPGHR